MYLPKRAVSTISLSLSIYRLGRHTCGIHVKVLTLAVSMWWNSQSLFSGILHLFCNEYAIPSEAENMIFEVLLALLS